MTDRLAAAVGIAASADVLAPLFAFTPVVTEWSFNAGNAGSARGAFRVSTWTGDHAAARAALARIAPDQLALRDSLVADDLEGVGLAFRAGEPATGRWWALVRDGEAAASRAIAAWPELAPEIDGVLRAAGGRHALVAVGIEAARRATIYVELHAASDALRVLELARIPVSQSANLFFKGVLGLEPGGRRWPRVWAARSIGQDGGWKFYYFARGDEQRRTDEVLLDAVRATAEQQAAWRLLREDARLPVVQHVGLAFVAAAPPAFTVYLARA
ncbi:MAG TPA: hypothetical protein VMJ10_01390 [Kofleriaceae bacterium]|nr:hypothetical protein [Kofleriaceae bacterium]